MDPLRQKLKGKSIFITGGLGMLGSLIARKLVSYEAKVSIADAHLEPYGANRFNISEIRDQVSLHTADIRDKEAMASLVRNKDIIFNFAAQVSHNDSISDPILDADINYMGHLNVLENVRRFNPKAKIIFPGTRLQFGRIQHNPVNEEHPLNPETPYAFNKTIAEKAYLYYHAMHKVNCVIFRIANPYGIHCQMKHSKYSILNYFLRQAMENKEIEAFGGGEQIRDYVYNEDLIDAFLLAAAEDSASGEIFNIGSGCGTRFIDMARLVVKKTGRGKVKQVPWPDDYVNVETGDFITDISKIQRVLGWVPKTTLDEGIEKTLQFYLKYREFYF